jgi:L-alanine-DL-glutamate epimerase-like enolase superfamily enzyme
MRKHLGEGFPLMADANMKWTVEEAIRAARALQPFDLTWLEEPTIPDDVAGHARILAAGGVPIAVGENLRTLWEFKNYIASGAVSYRTRCHQLWRRDFLPQDCPARGSVQSPRH